MMKTKIFYLGIAMIAILFTSCYKVEDSATLEDYDITLTYYNTDFNFQSYQTFMVRDSVMLISDYLTDEQKDNFYTEGNSEKIRTKIVNEFKALGYTEVTTSENPDFMVNPTLTLMQQTSVAYYPGWWWGYPGYWGWYGDWYWKSTNYYYPYWGYYPSWGASYYTYKTGTLIMEMADGKSVRDFQQWVEDTNGNGDAEDAPEIDFNWTGHVEGVIGDNAKYNEQRAANGISEAFTQSPYLKK